MQSQSGDLSPQYFYPRSPCGERLPYAARPCPVVDISIHALLAESDHCDFVQCTIGFIFLSTLSLRRATHMPDAHVQLSIFLSTLSLRRATRKRELHRQNIPISIHALLAESDIMIAQRCRILWYFYPRSPCGERRMIGKKERVKLLFLSTLSLRRATMTVW